MRYFYHRNEVLTFVGGPEIEAKVADFLDDYPDAYEVIVFPLRDLPATRVVRAGEKLHDDESTFMQYDSVALERRTSSGMDFTFPVAEPVSPPPWGSPTPEQVIEDGLALIALGHRLEAERKDPDRERRVDELADELARLGASPRQSWDDIAAKLDELGYRKKKEES